VPLWWDAGTLAALAASKTARLAQGADYTDPFLASFRPGRGSVPLSRHTLRKRYRTACKVLGPERLESLTIHHGRHTLATRSREAARWPRFAMRRGARM